MSKLVRYLIAIAIIIGITLPVTKPAVAGPVVPPPTWESMTWPLCGRIKEELGSAWNTGPTGPDCDYVSRIDTKGKTDFPIHHGFGYRNFNPPTDPSDPDRPISFHRGIDLATPGNTHDPTNDNPVFAAAGGYVKSIVPDPNVLYDPGDSSNPNPNYDPDYRDFKITLLHPANGATTCSTTNPCRISIYNHVSNVRPLLALLASGNPIDKGKHIAWTGTSTIGEFDHLHFEIRDPYVRAAVVVPDTNGKFSYSKDARNPMFYLPYNQRSGPYPLEVEITETPTYTNTDLEDTDVWVNISSAEQRYRSARYDFNLKSVTLKAYDGPVKPTIPLRAFTNQTNYPGTYVAAYEVNNNTFDVDNWSMQHTPFPTGSSKWTVEQPQNPYFAGTNPDGPDFFLEKNADATSISNGKKYADFDHKLITATPHTPGVSDSSWYNLDIGFTGIEPGTPGNQRCYEAEVVIHHPEIGDQAKTVTRCFP